MAQRICRSIWQTACFARARKKLPRCWSGPCHSKQRRSSHYTPFCRANHLKLGQLLRLHRSEAILACLAPSVQHLVWRLSQALVVGLASTYKHNNAVDHETNVPRSRCWARTRRRRQPRRVYLLCTLMKQPLRRKAQVAPPRSQAQDTPRRSKARQLQAESSQAKWSWNQGHTNRLQKGGTKTQKLCNRLTNPTSSLEKGQDLCPPLTFCTPAKAAPTKSPTEGKTSQAASSQ